DIGVRLLDFPVVLETIELVSLLRSAVLVGAVAGVVVLQERDGPLLPRDPVRAVPHDPQASAKAIPGRVLSLVVLQGELSGEDEYATRRPQVIGQGRAVPDPTALLGVLVPVVLAHGKRRLRPLVVQGDPVSVIAVDHVIAPAA